VRAGLRNPTARAKRRGLCAESTAVDNPGFSGELIRECMEGKPSALTASAAIELISGFMALVPESSREDMERLKMLDKFLNTARALMETRLKTEDAVEIAQRLDALEKAAGRNRES